MPRLLKRVQMQAGRVVWSQAALGGVLHGVALTGYHSDQDAIFHRLLLGLHARP